MIFAPLDGYEINFTKYGMLKQQILANWLF